MGDVSNGHLRAKGCAAFLGISQSTFWRWVGEGRIPKGTRLSTRCTVWPVAELEKFMERHRPHSGKEA